MDKSFKGDFFFIEQAKHKGTYKLKDRLRKKTIIDYTKQKGKIPSRIIEGKKYVSLDYIKKHIRKILKDKKSKYRWDKDRDTLNRILVYEKLKQKRK